MTSEIDSQRSSPPIRSILFMPFATRFELTEVHEDTHGDVFMPAPGPEWREVTREEHSAADGLPAYAFVTLVNRTQ